MAGMEGGGSEDSKKRVGRGSGGGAAGADTVSTGGESEPGWRRAACRTWDRRSGGSSDVSLNSAWARRSLTKVSVTSLSTLLGGGPWPIKALSVGREITLEQK